MKFLKPMLLTAFAFIGITATVLFSACEKDSCTDLTCYNGGACSGGFCHCTTGYEGAQCDIRSEDRFLGKYIGVTTCDSAAGLLDTVAIVTGSSNTQVGIVNSFNSSEVVYGTISITGGQYLIIVPTQTNNNVTTTYSISWNAGILKYNTVVVDNNSGVTKSDCTFQGKQQ